MLELLNNIRLGMSVAIVIANLILAVFVYKNNPKGLVNKLYGVLSLVTSVWVAVMYAAKNPDFLPTNLFWMRASIFLAVPQSILFFLLAHALPSGELQLKRKTLYWILGLAPLVMAVTMSPYAFTGLQLVDGDPQPVPGPGMLIFALFATALSAEAVYFLINKTKEAMGVKKQQLRIIMLGIFLMLGLIIFTIMIPVILFKFDFFAQFSPIYTLIFLGLIAYAIGKHRLFDVRVIVARAVLFLVLILAVAVIYALLLFNVAARIFSFQANAATFWVVLVLTSAAALTFQPLQELLRKLTNRIFFAGHYDADRLLSKLTETMTENLDLDFVTSRVLELLVKEMRLTKAAFLIVNNHKIVSVKGVGYKENQLKNPELESMFHNGFRARQHLILEGLEEGLLKETLRKAGVFVAIPIRVDEKEVAILALGAKLSGEIYYPADINLLDVFASGAGIAIENARLYTDLKFASESKSRFISVVSHQLRTPVSGIRWSLETMMQKETKKSEREELAGDAYGKTVFLGEQLDDILTALDIYDKKIFLKKEKCNLHDIYQNLLKEFPEIIKSKKLTIDCGIDREANEVSADYGKLEKVMKVLIKNALVYSPAGGKVKISAHFEDTPNKKRIMVSISDEGMGMAEEEREHVFDQFFRGDEARILSPNGLGLGMYIAKTFIEAHGGEMWFYSQGRNKGADFHFALPA